MPKFSQYPLNESDAPAKLRSLIEQLNREFKAIETNSGNYLPLAGGVLTGPVEADSNSSYTTRQVRNIILSTEDPDVDQMENGDIWMKYQD